MQSGKGRIMQFDRIRAMFFQRTLRACWCTCAPRSTVVPGMGSEASARAASVKFSSRQGRAAPLCLCAVSAERCPVAALSWRFDRAIRARPVPGRRFVLRDKVHLPPAPESTLFFRSCVILMTLSSVQNNCTPLPPPNPQDGGEGEQRSELWCGQLIPQPCQSCYAPLPPSMNQRDVGTPLLCSDPV